jgi:hypothetical protein
LDKAYKAWRAQPLPPECDDAELNKLHADLALVETWVAEAVVPFVEHTRYVFAAVDVSAGIRSVHDRAEELASLRQGDDAKLAREYAAYAERLEAVYGALERTVMETGLSN